MNRPIFAGVDVGGTNIKVGLVAANGEVIAKDQFPTESKRESSAGLTAAMSVIAKLLEANGIDESELTAIGLATPGPMDIPLGKVLTPFNLPGWHDQNVKQILSDLIKRPVTFANDATAAAYGEFWVGRGSKFSSIVLITLGTGVGGGIIVDGVSVDGAHSHGSEVGHMVIDCSDNARVCACGAKGHLEAYASATAIVKRCNELLNANHDSVDSVLSQIENVESNLTTFDVFQAALDNDELAIKVIDETADYLACGVVSLAHVIDPAAILLGGAVNFGGERSPVGLNFIERIRDRVKRIALPRIGEMLKIEFTTLGPDAGFIGAAGMAKHKYDLSQSNHPK